MTTGKTIKYNANITANLNLKRKQQIAVSRSDFPVVRGQELMKFSQAKQGRIFVVRLENGDIVHEELEKLAREQFIKAAAVIILGGANSGSKLIVGPQDGRSQPVKPIDYLLEDVHEVTGTGAIFPDKHGKPALHMHMACGRRDSTITGCVRNGVTVWHVMEAIVFELVDTAATRILDEATGFALLRP